jgi:hypothetical protein
MAGLTQPTSMSNSGWTSSQTYSGGVAPGQQSQQNPYWWPKSNSELKAYYSEQNSFLKDQADAITKLLGGLNTQGQTATTAPIDLSKQLNNKMPDAAPVVNSPSGGFIDPTKSVIPGMSSPPPGSLPSLTAQPSTDALTQTAAKIDQQAALPSAPTLTVPQGQGAFPPFRPNMTPSGLPSSGQGTLPSAPVASAPSIGNSLNNLAGGLTKAFQTYQQNTAPQDPSVRSYMPSNSPYNVMPSGIAGQSGFIASSMPTAGAGQIAASGGEGYLPASANTGAVVGPSVVPDGSGGFSTDPSVASANQPTDSAAAGAGAGASAAGIGGAIGSGIQAIAAALTPKNLPNDAAKNINANLLPKPIVFSAPQLTGR